MNIHSKILRFIRREEVITSSELADYLKVSWNTADKYLIELLVDGKVKRFKKKGVTIWLPKK
ncbi:MAG: DUF977 family protein [Candidatus Woesearchaeota archaeon]|nr:MAG: DUF977 family protein [Candidatus Woesearchaeota archaeon]